MSSVLRKRLQTAAEEMANALTHGLGLVLSIAALAILVGYASRDGGARHIVAAAMFGGALILLYTTSTLYHSVHHQGVKKILRVLDHASIYLLIAGTYTPFTLVTLSGPWGWGLFTVVWTLAIAGIALELSPWRERRWIPIALYLIMGWSVLGALGPLLANLATGGVVLLFLGGVSYTLGVVFYLWRSLQFHHAVWHGFVLLGSVLHFFAVLVYVLPDNPLC